MTTNNRPAWLDPRSTDCSFPDVSLALDEPNGLLAVGGRLSPQCLLTAYERGIFPWYSEDQPILWWSPNPRAVMYPHALKLSRSLTRTLRHGHFRVTLDAAFDEVINGCARPRRDSHETWITPEMQKAYVELHRLGYAHSAETWQGERLVGGVYGVAIGAVFFGESMFHRETNASKVAFAYLVRQLERWGFPLIDCQIESRFLRQLGATALDRAAFVKLLSVHCAAVPRPGPWRLESIQF